MNKRERLLDEIKQIPEALLDELADYVQFLKLKTAKERLGSIGESSLKGDWLKAEEEEAWKNL